jgi:hypothetical protein
MTPASDDTSPAPDGAAAGAADAAEQPRSASAARRPTPPWMPSGRLTAVLATVMLGAGVGLGAAIGPAPASSLANAARLPLLLHWLLAGTSHAPPPASAGPVAAPASEVATAPVRRRHRRHASGAEAASAAPSEPVSSGTGTPGSEPRQSGRQPSNLPAINKVWLVELAGSGFSEALASAASAPYIDSQAIPAGALLGGWSAVQGSAFASDAALIGTRGPELVESVVQPTCPEGAAGTPCAAGTPAGLSTADAFLKQTLTTLSASAAYRSGGLIVVTFAAIAPGAASELPSGSTTATLASQPPAGVLVISPFTRPAQRASTSFDASSPRTSLEALLHR